MWFRSRVASLALLIATTAHAQGIPVTRAAIDAQKGWEAIRQGRYQEAADAFAFALTTAPRDPVLHLGAGVAAYRLGQTATARQSLERALDLAPSLTAASLLLGSILSADNELHAALQVYEAARAYAPDNPEVALRLQRARQEFELHSRFFQTQGAHFTVLFEGPADEELARRVLEVLETAYWEVGTALLTFPDRAVPVILYTEEQFRDVTRSPGWAAAAYDGRIRVPMRGALSNPKELERVLTHEFAHALVQSLAPRGVPTWLNEGLAVVFEARGAEWTAAQPDSRGDGIPLTRLTGSFEGLSGAQARMAYARSATAVRALLDRAGGPAIAALLQDLGRGDPLDSAFERRILVSFSWFADSLDHGH